MDRKPASGGKTPKSTLANAGHQHLFEAMVTEFAHNAHINKGKNMSLNPNGNDSSDEEGKKEKRLKVQEEVPNRDDLEMGNIFTSDKNKMDLLLHLNSSKLLEISAKF